MRTLGNSGISFATPAGGLDRKSDDFRQSRAAVYEKHSDKTAALAKEAAALQEQIHELVPAPQRQSLVWLYERL